jgi:SpoVK/Ycf46/Vps4 family AAA+-type ATPase
MKRKISLNGIKYIDHEGVAHISKDVTSIDDLIDLGNTYEHGRKYNIDLKRIYDIRDSLIKLRNMVGLKEIKTTLVNQIVYFLQDFHGDDMLHTIIQGPPGVGKTMLANIIGEIYYRMNIFKSTDEQQYKFVIAKRSDLIGEYLGTTAMKTQKVINKSVGGVLLIDEAYSLGNSEGRDSYSKECIDTLNQNLSENKKNFLCIIAGYKDALNENFFNYNEGLRRRFPFVYTIDMYSSEELTHILYDIFRRDRWVCIRNDKINKLFEHNYKAFQNMAGDIETLAFVTKIEHSKRVLFLHKSEKKVITIVDINNGMKRFLENRELKKNEKDTVLSHMYM